MMKITTSLAALAISISISIPASAEEEITIRVADYLPSGHILYEQGLKFFMDRVNELSSNRVTFDYFPGEQLGKAKDLLDLAGSGAADITLIAPSYTSEKMPLTTIAELPGLYTTSCQGTAAFMPATAETGILGKEFAKNGVRSIMSFMYQPADLLATNKSVDTAGAWKGLKVRVAGGPTELAVDSMGGVAVKMAATDMYQSMSRGTVDAVLLVSSSAKSYGLDTVAKNITTGFSLGSVASAYVMNEKSWQRLPDDLKKIFEQAGDEAAINICQSLDKLENSELNRMEKDGVKIKHLDETTRNEWKSLTEKLVPEWAKRVKLSPEDVMAIYTELQPE